MFKLKRITSALIIAILLIIPSVADASSITTISSQQFDAFEIKRMVETGEFNGADVKRETTYLGNGLTMESTLIRETINQSNNININIKDDKNHSSNFEYTPKSVVHNWSEIRKSGQDGARTATVYVTAVFDSQYVNGVEYVKPDQVRFSIFMHDNTFRPVYVDGVAVNDGYGAVDRYGNLMGGYVREFLPTRVNYPTPGYSYGGSTNFSYYLNNQSFNMIGGSAEFTIERGSTGGSVTRIKVDAFY